MNSSYTVAVVTLLAILIRSGVMLHPYSGEHKPPMYGDYEAQRHWMEITLNTDVADWYRNTTQNDLQYWGLDYPPLTAWHSRLLGMAGAWLEPKSMALHSSRGYSTPSSKLFMRLSVLATDVLLYFSGALAFCLSYKPERWKQHFAIMLLQPAIILIDHGHFQYNTVSLGLTLWAIAAILNDFDVIGSSLFCLALNHKQMSMYHAPAFFFFLLGKHRRNMWQIVKIGMVVVVTFAICWISVCQSMECTLQVLHRLAPFARGLYEDKVASIWCIMAPLLRLKEWMSMQQQVTLCLITTIAALMPSVIILFHTPTPRNLVTTLISSSLSFFLFSYQVHEKSILLAVLPVSMMWAEAPWLSSGFSLVATFSMWPLLAKDGLTIAYIACIGMFLCVSYLYNGKMSAIPLYSTVFVFVFGHVAWTFVNVPRYPDVPSLFIAALSAGCFMLSLMGVWAWQWRKIKTE